MNLYFEGGSRKLWDIGNGELKCQLKPTIFSFAKKAHIELAGIDEQRVRINEIFCRVLEENGVKTCLIRTEFPYIIMKKEKVANIEVIVKTALVGTPKHIYKNIENTPTRFGKPLAIGERHKPYVRFDWRNPLPFDDMCMSDTFADDYINAKQAKKTALKAYDVLQKFLLERNFDLIDICFFMNVEGDTICGEVSTDNTQIRYKGKDPRLIELFSSREKKDMILKAKEIYAACHS